MPILYAGIVPHSPTLLPTIGKTELAKLQKTLASLRHMNVQLLEKKIETVVMVAPRNEAPQKREGILIHLPERYDSRFEEFGDLSTQKDYTPDTMFAHAMKKDLEEDGHIVSYTSEKKLGYSSGVPLFHLLRGINAKLLVIYPAECSLKKQFEFGRNLQKSLQKTDKKIACIISGDLAHHLARAQGDDTVNDNGIFDQEIVSFIKARKVRKLQTIDTDRALRLGACGVSGIVVLFGLLTRMHSKGHFLSFENPLGVGQLVMEYTF